MGNLGRIRLSFVVVVVQLKVGRHHMQYRVNGADTERVTGYLVRACYVLSMHNNDLTVQWRVTIIERHNEEWINFQFVGLIIHTKLPQEVADILYFQLTFKSAQFSLYHKQPIQCNWQNISISNGKIYFLALTCDSPLLLQISTVNLLGLQSAAWMK